MQASCPALVPSNRERPLRWPQGPSRCVARRLPADEKNKPLMKRIKDVRKLLGLSLSEVALRAGLHRRAVARLELEKHDPRASTIAAIAKAMNVPVCELFDESGHDRGAGE